MFTYKGRLLILAPFHSAATSYLSFLWVCSVLVLPVSEIPALLHQLTLISSTFSLGYCSWLLSTLLLVDQNHSIKPRSITLSANPLKRCSSTHSFATSRSMISAVKLAIRHPSQCWPCCCFCPCIIIDIASDLQCF